MPIYLYHSVLMTGWQAQLHLPMHALKVTVLTTEQWAWFYWMIIINMLRSDKHNNMNSRQIWIACKKCFGWSVGRFDRNCGRRDSGGGYGWDDRDHNEGDCGWYDKEYDDWDCGCGDCGGWGDNGVDRERN